MSTEQHRRLAGKILEASHFHEANKDPVESILALLADFERTVRLEERKACIDDIQDAVGQWGGPEREHYTQAMHRSIDAINKRTQGLDLWGNPLDAGAAPKA